MQRPRPDTITQARRSVTREAMFSCAAIVRQGILGTPVALRSENTGSYRCLHRLVSIFSEDGLSQRRSTRSSYEHRTTDSICSNTHEAPTRKNIPQEKLLFTLQTAVACNQVFRAWRRSEYRDVSLGGVRAGNIPEPARGWAYL